MRRAFAIAVLLWIVFEFANVWFIMPLPYSQRVRSIDIAYALYAWRWAIRAVIAAVILASIVPAWRTVSWRKWLVPVALLIAVAATYVANVVMAADHVS